MTYIRKSVRDKLKLKEEIKPSPLISPKEHKYVVYNKGKGPRAIVFSPDEVHRDIAMRICGLQYVISAGFCKIRDGDVICYGESVSLDKKSRDEDAVLIKSI